MGDCFSGQKIYRFGGQVQRSGVKLVPEPAVHANIYIYIYIYIICNITPETNFQQFMKNEHETLFWLVTYFLLGIDATAISDLCMIGAKQVGYKTKMMKHTIRLTKCLAAHISRGEYVAVEV